MDHDGDEIWFGYSSIWYRDSAWLGCTWAWAAIHVSLGRGGGGAEVPCLQEPRMQASAAYVSLGRTWRDQVGFGLRLRPAEAWSIHLIWVKRCILQVVSWRSRNCFVKGWFSPCSLSSALTNVTWLSGSATWVLFDAQFLATFQSSCTLYSLQFNDASLTGAPSSASCLLCLAGTYWTGSGWHPGQSHQGISRHILHSDCLEFDLTWKRNAQAISPVMTFVLADVFCAEVSCLQEPLMQEPANSASLGHTLLAQVWWCFIMRAPSSWGLRTFLQDFEIRVVE
jgi:hypothetical protein